jgi:hypothetical protein
LKASVVLLGNYSVGIRTTPHQRSPKKYWAPHQKFPEKPPPCVNGRSFRGIDRLTLYKKHRTEIEEEGMKLTMGRVLAIALAVTLLGIGATALHAKDNASQQVCPSTVSQSCVVPQAPACTSCPVDPKKLRKEEEARQKAEAKAAKEAEHAQHEAAEACERNQRHAEHERQKAAEEQAEANEHMSKANELATNMCCRPSEPIAESKPAETETTIAIVEPTPAPTPAPEVTTPAPAPEVVTPPPAPIAQAEPPKELPRTASPMGLIGLIGLLSMSGSLAGWFRR